MKLSCFRNGLSGSVDLPNTNSPSLLCGGKPAPLVDAVLRLWAATCHWLCRARRNGAESVRLLPPHGVENRQSQCDSPETSEESAAVDLKGAFSFRCLRDTLSDSDYFRGTTYRLTTYRIMSFIR